VAKRLWRPREAERVLARRDEGFARLRDTAGPMALDLRPSTFASIARAIAYQQLAGAAASAIWARVTALFSAGGFDAPAVLRRRDTTYRRAGLSGAKTRSIKDLARHVVDGRFVPEALYDASDQEVIEHLTAVWGIGPWSAQMHLIFSLGREDVWPVLDLGVRRGWARYAGGPVPSAKDLAPLGDAYRPYRSILAWYMWRVLDVEDWA